MAGRRARSAGKPSAAACGGHRRHPGQAEHGAARASATRARGGPTGGTCRASGSCGRCSATCRRSGDAARGPRRRSPRRQHGGRRGRARAGSPALPGPVRRRGAAPAWPRSRPGHPHGLPRRQPARRRQADHRDPRLRRRARRAGRDGRRRRRLLPARHRAPTPLAPALDVVAGYHAVDPLDGADLELAAEFIVARVVARIIVSQWNALREPANRGYLLRRTPQAIEHFAALRRR